MIYCTGDSFTAGDELADHMFFDDHPGYLFFLKSGQRSAWHLNKKIDNELRKKLEVENKKRAWPAKLAELTGLDVINNGASGTSTGQKVNEAILECITNKNIKTVIFQLIYDTRIYRAYQGRMNSVQLGYEYPDNSDLGEQARYFILHESDYTLRMQWLYDLIRLKDFCAGNGIRLIFINANANAFLIPPGLETLASYLDISITVSMKQISLSLCNQKIKSICPGGHYTEQVHVEVAQQLKDKLNEIKC